MDNLTTIKDANGKEISVNLSNIADFNGDIGPDSTVGSAKDARKNRVSHVHEVKFVDARGNELNQEKLLADAKNGAVNIVALDVEMEATHSGPNHNYCIYYEDSMEKDAESFTNPFKKPVLKNHDSYSGEPLGRILQAWHGPSALTEDRSAIHLKTRITDQEAIPKFLDGRYSTVSIAGSMGTVTCNICGKTILKDGKFKFCGHWRGETYKDQVCYWGAKDIEYHEVSTVNNPADDFAQIMKVTVLTDKDEKKEGSDNMDGTNNTQSTQTQASAEAIRQSAQKMVDMIDQLLGKPAGVADGTQPETTPTPTTTDGQQQPAAAPAADGEPSADPAPAGTADSTAELQGKLDKATADLTAANDKIKELETKLADSESKLAKANTDLADAQAEAKSMKDMCLTLAASNKEMVVDSIIAKENLAEDKVEDRKKELMAKSMKDLTAMTDASTQAQQQQPRTPTQVPNPALADTSKDDGGAGTPADANKAADGKNAKRTVDDFATDIIGKLFNK